MNNQQIVATSPKIHTCGKPWGNRAPSPTAGGVGGFRSPVLAHQLPVRLTGSGVRCSVTNCRWGWWVLGCGDRLTGGGCCGGWGLRYGSLGDGTLVHWQTAV